MAQSKRRRTTFIAQERPARASFNATYYYVGALMIGLVILAGIYASPFLAKPKNAANTLAPNSTIEANRKPARITIERPTNRLPEITLGPAHTVDGVTIQQSYLKSPAGKIFLDHYPIEYVSRQGSASPASGESSEHFVEPNSQWSHGSEAEMVLATYNCFTFAVAPFIGLMPTDQMEAAPAQGFDNPLEVVFNAYFTKVATFDLEKKFNGKQFDIDHNLRHDDVFCLIKKSFGETTYVHAGRINKLNGKNLIVSKFGRMGPLLRTNLKYVFRYYDGTEIRIFRFDPTKRIGSAP